VGNVFAASGAIAPATTDARLTIDEVCDRLGLSSKNIARTAKDAGFGSTDQYLASRGFVVVGTAGRRKLYAPNPITSQGPALSGRTPNREP
jgi:hypothetical protein